MTTVGQIIIDAYRQSNLLSINSNPTDIQNTEGLRYLDRIVRSIYGNEAGELLEAFPIGRNNIQAPAGYPWYDQTPYPDWFVPMNKRLILNLDGPATIYLHPNPDDGARFGILDVSGNLSTYPLTIFGNGKLIDGLNEEVFSTNGVNQEWFYRADLGNWVTTVPISDLAGTFPFPEEFDDLFITYLAMRLNPSYGMQLNPQIQDVLRRAKEQLRARYHTVIQTHSEFGLLRLPQTAVDRYLYGPQLGYYDANSTFNMGYPW